MEIQLLYLPGPPFFKRSAVKSFFVHMLHAIADRIGTKLMRAMPILALGIVGQYDIRLIMTNHIRNECSCVLFFPALICLLQRPAEGVVEFADHRIIVNAHGPKSIQQFAAPRRIRITHIYDHDVLFSFDGIVRNRTAKEKELVVWVRCNEHEVGFFFRRFPLLYPVRQIAFAKDIYFVDFELRFLSRRVDQAKVLRTVQGQHCMIVIPGARLQQTPLPCGFHFNRPAARHFAKADIEPICRLIFRGLKLKVTVFLFPVSPETGIFPIVHGVRCPAG